MNLISAFLFACSVNIDSFIIGLSYGTKQISMSIIQNLFLSTLTTLGTIIALLLGQRISVIFPTNWMQLCGNLFLILLGSYYIFKPLLFHFLRFHPNHIQSATTFFSNHPASASLSFQTCISLALSLTLNNFGIGISASITGFVLLPTTICTFVSSVLFLFSGNLLGRRYAQNVNEVLGDILCGLILVLLGIIDYLPF